MIEHRLRKETRIAENQFGFVQPIILYGSQCWALKQHERKVGVGEIIMLRWMCSHTKKDIIQYCIQGDINMAPIKEKMIENQFN